MWRRGEEIFAEVAVPQAAGVTVAGYGIHPVLLDAALHALGMDDAQAQAVLPFSWQGVCLHAAGASRVRVRLSPVGAGAVSLELADPAGLPVLTVRELVLRPVSAEQLSAGAPGPVAAASSSRPGRRCHCRPTAVPRRRWCGSRARRTAPACRVWCTRPRTRRWACCSPGWPATGRACSSCRPAGRWAFDGEEVTDPAPRRCGAWSVRRRRSTRAGCYCLIPTSIDVDTVIACGEPQGGRAHRRGVCRPAGAGRGFGLGAAAGGVAAGRGRRGRRSRTWWRSPARRPS
ncbi:polyketide synthase dehydratase domain-containing protein [Mycobacterium interjectum]|nr:polyketide synthase dehydratase domain-containing protein [Mycobacterium interjectum]